MSIIPLLICLYLITVRFFSVNALIGLDGFYFLLSIFIALLGLFFGRNMIHDIVQDLLISHSRIERSSRELHVTIERLQTELLTHAADKAQLQRTHQELQATQDQLIQAEKFESSGRLAKRMADEIKHPLTSILLATHFLFKHTNTDDDKTQDALRNIEDSVKQVDTIIEDLSNLSGAQRGTPHQETVNTVVEKALFLMDQEFKKNNIKIVKKLGRNLPKIALDHEKFNQALVSVYRNALQAMPDGGILTVATYTDVFQRIQEKSAVRRPDQFHEGEEVFVIDIEDTGAGISEKDITKIFDPFFTTRTVKQGSGLGLTLSRNIIESHNGTISVTNRPGGGVLAKIVLKIPAPEA
ncbi:MAG: hypothetical protein JW937_03500 [Candidatus Omnitrophica bacterium]|nr:hypothetical protein [Candidatus Omnitrophota bacterium]